MWIRSTCLLVAALVSAPVAAVELYKWVDETGAVTYGDTPPAKAKSVRALGKDAGSVSVVPGISPEQLERMRNTERDLRMRRLELEVEELRLREQRLAQMPSPNLAYADPSQEVGWGGYWGGGYPIAGAAARRDKRFWPRPVHHSRPDLDLLPLVRARELTTPTAAGPANFRR